MRSRKFKGATLPLPLMLVALIAGCGGGTNPTAPVETIEATAPPSPMPISPLDDEGLDNGNDNGGQPARSTPARGPQVSPGGE